MNASLEVLRGGTAVITGAGSGIGEGIAREAANAGMCVVVSDLDIGRARAVAESIQATGGQAHALQADVSDAGAMERLAANVHERFGDVRLLVNNAGIEVLGESWTLSPATWNRAIGVNVLGVVYGVRAFVPRMLATGHRAYVANLSSVGGLGMMPAQTAYIVSKHAVLSFTECLALEIELTGKPISVSAVLPGPVRTRIFDDAPAGPDATAVSAHRLAMQSMLQGHGMDIRDAAQRILEGVAQGRFWVSTHPDRLAAAARQRAAYLGELERPSLSPAARAILGLAPAGEKSPPRERGGD
jgi:NAD(P)-dependent dehydrogenase (short-subunit alcohol dehydrogenase family)